MKPYYEQVMASKEGLRAYNIAVAVVEAMPDPVGRLRCHEVVHVVSRFIESVDHGIRHGKYGIVEHSWIEILDRRLRCIEILDCYSVGSMPQVQLHDVSSLGVRGRYALYQNGMPRSDIDEDRVQQLIDRIRGGYALQTAIRLALAEPSV